MNIAVLTGASSGLGIEFFKAVSAKYPELDEIWLIARRKERMEETAKDSGITARIFPLDLIEEDSLCVIKDALAKDDIEIKLLINNAGFGILGNIDGSDYKQQMDMVSLNCRALTGLTTICLPYMKKGSKIINVCSIAAFAPNPRLTVYSATKSYVMFYSRSLRYELKEKGIGVTALCPGPMRTEFLTVGKITGNSKTFDDFLPYVDPKKAVAGVMKASDKNRAVYTPKAYYRLYRFIAKILPKEWVMPISKA